MKVLTRKRVAGTLCLFGGVLVLAVGLALVAGPSGLGPGAVWTALWGEAPEASGMEGQGNLSSLLMRRSHGGVFSGYRCLWTGRKR